MSSPHDPPPRHTGSAKLALVCVPLVGLTVLLTLFFRGVFDRPATPPPVQPILDPDELAKAISLELAKLDTRSAQTPAALPMQDFSKHIQEATGPIIRRNEELGKQIVAAEKTGDDEEVKKLTAERKKGEAALVQIRDQIGDMTKAVKDLEKDPKSGRVPERKPPASLTNPPNLPEAETNESSPMQSLLRAGAVGLCFFKPELCWIGMLVGVELGLFEKIEHRRAYFGVMQKMMTGKQLSILDIGTLTRVITASPKPGGFGPGLKQIQEKAIPKEIEGEAKKELAPAWKKIDERNSKANEPEVVARLRKAMGAEESLAAVKKILPQREGRPYFNSPNEKDRVEALCRGRDGWADAYWEGRGGLKEVEVLK